MYKPSSLFKPLLALLCLPVCTLLPAQAQGIEPPAPTLFLDFENGVDGIGRDGQSIAARVDGKAEFQGGKFGQAFKSGPGAGYLYFPTQDILSRQFGTVEMWVMPIDWNGDEKAFHMFFNASGKGNLYLYKYLSSSLGLTILSHDGGKEHNRLSYRNIDSWKAGGWYHIAFTWSPLRQVLYIDGKIAAQGLPLLPESLGKEFLIGDHYFNADIPRSSQSLIDNVRVYDRVLSAEVITAHATDDFTKTTPLDDNSAQIDFNVENNRIATKLVLNGADVNVAQAQAHFSIKQGEQTIAQQTGQAFQGMSAATDFADNLKPGEYILSADVRDAQGQSLGTVNKPFTVPSREWQGNTIGLEKKVLAPWTPMQVRQHSDGFSVHCWEREYRFGNGLLPLQITAQGEPLLKSPMALKVLSGRTPLRWATSLAQVKNASDYEVNVVTTATADTQQGKVTIEANFHLEYDGVMLLSLKFQTPAGFSADSVTLDIPLHEQRALYRHGWQADLKTFSGALPAGTGAVQQGAFLPAFWLGDNDRGLFWFSESAQHWPNWKSETAFQAVRENQAVTMRFNLLSGQAVPQNWRFEFGLQATPVKPLPRDWRRHQLTPSPKATAEIYWPTPAQDAVKHFGYAQARNPEVFQNRVNASKAAGRAAVPYTLLTAVSGGSPEWKWFGKEWDVKAGDHGSGDVVATGAPIHYVSPTQKSWHDFVIWKTKQFIETHKLGGIYHDLSYPFAWAVPEVNTGWFDGKEWQKTHPMLAYRDLYRRNRAMVKAANPDALLIGHMSSRIHIPVLGYEDAYLNGETFLTAMRGKESYLDVMGLDQWRAEYTGRQWGVMPIFLPEFDTVHRATIEPTRGLAALLLLHDTGVWSILSNGNVWKQMYDAMHSFGYIDSDFIPYWDATPPAKTDMADVYASAYKRADGRALVVVGNTSKEARTGTVTLDTERLGLDTSQVVTWPDKKPVTRNGDKIEISLERLDYQLLLIGKAP